MKATKKLIALALALVMCFSCLSTLGLAARDNSYVPTIVIPGLFQSETKYYVDGKVATNLEGEPYEAPFFLDTTLEIVAAALEDALIPISEMLIKQEDKDQKAATALADLLGEVLLEKSRCDENGDFVHDVRATKYNDSVADLSEYDREYVLDAVPLQNYVDIAGGENLYFFSYASLGNMQATVNELYEFIEFVKDDAQSEKVNLVPISQGGSIMNGLMQTYVDKGRSIAEDVNRIVYVIPALNGSTLIGEIFQMGLLDDDYNIYNTMFPSLMGEDDMLSYLVNVVLRIMPNADLNNILDVAVNTLVKDYMRYSTLMWGLCPAENYNEEINGYKSCREQYLLDEGLENILQQADWYYNAQINSDAYILDAIDDGVEVFDIVDYNVRLYELCDSFDDVNADGIIQLDSTSMGAYSRGVDKLLPIDYVPTHSNCTNPDEHDHTDPNGIVDPCTGLLPETTFYFYNQNHERTASNDVIMKLATALLTDENFTDVRSYPDRFPQFNVGRNSKGFINDVNAMKDFDTSKLTAEDKAEFEGAMIQAQAVIDNTVVDLNEFEAAKARFYEIRGIITSENYGQDVPEEPKENDAYLDFGDALRQIFEILSKVLYMFFGGAGFGEM